MDLTMEELETAKSLGATNVDVINKILSAIEQNSKIK